MSSGRFLNRFEALERAEDISAYLKDVNDGIVAAITKMFEMSETERPKDPIAFIITELSPKTTLLDNDTSLEDVKKNIADLEVKYVELEKKHKELEEKRSEMEKQHLNKKMNNLNFLNLKSTSDDMHTVG